MASGGPVTISDEDLAKFRAIMSAKGAEQQALMKALPTDKKRLLALHIQSLKAKQADLAKSNQKIQSLKSDIQVSDAREDALKGKDRSILTQASSSYTPAISTMPSAKPPAVRVEGSKFKY